MSKSEQLSSATVISLSILDRVIVAIGEAAEITGVSPRQLRYWEAKGIIKSINDGSGTRRYDYSNIEKIVLLKDFLDQGFTLVAAAKRLDQRINQLNSVIKKLEERYASELTPETSKEKPAYEILGFARHRTTLEEFIVFRDNTQEEPIIWIEEKDKRMSE